MYDVREKFPIYVFTSIVPALQWLQCRKIVHNTICNMNCDIPQNEI